MGYTPPTENDILDSEGVDTVSDVVVAGPPDEDSAGDAGLSLVAGSVDVTQDDPHRDMDENFNEENVYVDPEEQDQEMLSLILEPDDNNQSFDLNDLLAHINAKNLNLRLRRPSSTDGNCLYDSLCDLCEKFDIPNVPREKGLLRKAVCNSLTRHPEFPRWMKEIFRKPAVFQKYLATMMKSGQWSDNFGIITAAAAHLIGKTRLGVDRVKPCN